MKKRIACALLAAVGILLLIFDSKTAIAGAQEGLDLCLSSLIPSLFPFLVLSAMLASSFGGACPRQLHHLCRMMKIPDNAAGIFLTGLVGGYPSGAQAVAQAWRNGQLTKPQAQKLLAISNQAGPAFLFGIVAARFDRMGVVWILWGIQILSAILTGILLPAVSDAACSVTNEKSLSLTQALKQGVTTMGYICGWVVLFRMLILFLNRWILWLLPMDVQVFIAGLLELTNGCCQLELVKNQGLRFIICSGLLAFGGICVTLQTASVIGAIGIGHYLVGKLMQTIIALCLAAGMQLFLPYFSERTEISVLIPISIALSIVFCGIFLGKTKKTVAFRPQLVYNHCKRMIGGQQHAVPKEN